MDVFILVAESTLHKHYVMLNHYTFYIILFYNFQCQNWLPWPPTGDPCWNLEAPEWTCVRLKVSGHELLNFIGVWQSWLNKFYFICERKLYESGGIINC